MLGRSIDILFSGDALQTEPLRYDLLFKGETVHKDRPLIRKDGSRVEVSMTRTKVDANCLQSIVHDVSELRQAEDALRKSEERFRLAVKGSRDGLWDWNLETDEAFHSSQFARMLGFEPEELPYTSDAWMELLHPEDRKAALDRVATHLSGKSERYESTFRMRTKSGEYRWITGRGMAIRDEKGKPKRFLGFNTDITEQKEQEREIAALLAEKDALLREINHRVKNNLAMIASLISLKVESSGSDVDLSDIRMQIDAIRLVPSKVAVSLGLILNELATNAVKHAFLDAEEAIFSVGLIRDSSEHPFLLTVSNSGPPIEKGKTLESTGSLGMRLVAALVEQIGGSMEVRRQPRTTFAIRFASEENILGAKPAGSQEAERVPE